VNTAAAHEEHVISQQYNTNQSEAPLKVTSITLPDEEHATVHLKIFEEH
jgi:hypothetical protein